MGDNALKASSPISCKVIAELLCSLCSSYLRLLSHNLKVTTNLDI